MKKGWDVYNFTDQVHVIPTGENHKEDIDCPCNPKIEIHEKTLIVHSAYDNREYYEQNKLN